MNSKSIYLEKTKNFIQKAKEVHGCLYDYSNSNFINSSTKIEIICKKHGAWFTLPANHIKNKCGCPKCAKEAIVGKCKRTTESAIKEFTKTHGNRYDYSKFTYNSAREKSTIICNKHGEFRQSFDSHVRGVGCSKCAREPKPYTNFKDLEKEMLDKWGSKFSYHEETYTGKKHKMKMTCPTHGDFEQAPSLHLSLKHGCPKCGDYHSTDSRRSNTDEAIKKFIETHGNLYDYSLVEYKGNLIPVEIICPEHGVFTQTPKNHKKGAGCQLCGFENIRENKQLKLEVLFERFNEIHKNKYSYNLEHQPSNSSEKIEIVCPEHGSFQQTISGHLTGRGCRKCAYEYNATKSRAPYSKRYKKAKLYLVKISNNETGTQFLKIGITKNTPEFRLRQIGDFEIETLLIIESKTSTILKMEEFVIEENEDIRFRVHDLKESISGGWTECFRYSDLGAITDSIEKSKKFLPDS